MRLKNWHIVAIIIGLIILLIISGAIQYHYAQKQVTEIRKSQADIYPGIGKIYLRFAKMQGEINVLRDENNRLVENLNSLYVAVTPTHDLPMMAEAITK